MGNLIRIHSWMLLGLILFVPKIQAQQADEPKNDPREQPIEPYPADTPAFRRFPKGPMRLYYGLHLKCTTTEVQVPAGERCVR